MALLERFLSVIGGRSRPAEVIRLEEIEEVANGPAVAAVLASAFGVFVLGLVTTLAAAVEDFKNWLSWDDTAGPLSGKTSLALAAWIGVWLPLHVLLRKRNVDVRLVSLVSAVLIIISFFWLMMPPFFERLGP